MNGLHFERAKKGDKDLDDSFSIIDSNGDQHRGCRQGHGHHSCSNKLLIEACYRLADISKIVKDKAVL